MEMDFDKLINWLEHYGLPQHHTHVSGHVMPLTLKDLLERIHPKYIIPIHGNHELFKRFARGLDSIVLKVERDKEYELTTS